MRLKRPNERTLQVLKMIALGALIIAAGAAPSPRVLAKAFKRMRIADTPKNRKWIRRRLYALHEKRYVEIRNDNLSISELGERLLAEDRLRALRPIRPKTWDGVWHIVVFDIPQAKAGVRIPFVRMLQHLGFLYYQRSIWIHPYACEDEVREIALFYDIVPFVSFIKAVHVDGSHAFRQHFKLPTR